MYFHLFLSLSLINSMEICGRVKVKLISSSLSPRKSCAQRGLENSPPQGRLAVFTSQAINHEPPPSPNLEININSLVLPPGNWPLDIVQCHVHNSHGNFSKSKTLLSSHISHATHISLVQLLQPTFFLSVSRKHLVFPASEPLHTFPSA